MSQLQLDAQALYASLLAGVRQHWRPGMRLVGIWSGGAWLAERLHRDLGLIGQHGVISSQLHRDDFGSRGLSAADAPTALPFAIEGEHLMLVDDVLYTGRTIRAAMNELFDFGRPASITLVTLVDRGGRELPIEPIFAAARVSVPNHQRLSLSKEADGTFSFDIESV